MEPFDRCLQPEIYTSGMDSLHRNCEMEPRASDSEDPQGVCLLRWPALKGAAGSPDPAPRVMLSLHCKSVGPVQKN